MLVQLAADFESTYRMSISSPSQVMKTIEKIKKKKVSAKQAKVDRKLLRLAKRLRGVTCVRAAKEQGAIQSIKVVREILASRQLFLFLFFSHSIGFKEGKKKAAFKPDGRERARDKRVRVAREKRLRSLAFLRSFSFAPGKCPIRTDGEEEEEEPEEDDVALD